MTTENYVHPRVWHTQCHGSQPSLTAQFDLTAQQPAAPVPANVWSAQTAAFRAEQKKLG
jgi:hypothetical protein